MASLFRDALRSECQNDDHDARNIVKLTSPSTAEEVEEEETRSVSTSTLIELRSTFATVRKYLAGSPHRYQHAIKFSLSPSIHSTQNSSVRFDFLAHLPVILSECFSRSSPSNGLVTSNPSICLAAGRPGLEVPPQNLITNKVSSTSIQPNHPC